MAPCHDESLVLAFKNKKRKRKCFPQGIICILAFSVILLATGNLYYAISWQQQSAAMLHHHHPESSHVDHDVFFSSSSSSSSTSSPFYNLLSASAMGWKSLSQSASEMYIAATSTNHNDDDPLFPIPQRTPTHTACQDDQVQGILHIAMGDNGGAAGTTFFQFVVGQILYAEQHQLKPWIHFNNFSSVIYDENVHRSGSDGVHFKALGGRQATYVHRPDGHPRDYTPGALNASLPVTKTAYHFEGTGVWDHYFEPASDFVPGDVSCQDKLYVTLDLYLITPGIHTFAEWAPRCWRYRTLPDYLSKPHLPLTEWLEPQRRVAHRVVQQYIHVRPHLMRAAQQVNPNCSLQRQACLGLHIRHSDKASHRRVVETAEFLPFAEAFVAAGGSHIYLATDSTGVLEEIEQLWPVSVKSKIRTLGNEIVRSDDTTAVFDMESHHRTNQEALIEILALSQCQFMVHGLSAMSESAIWINLDLHARSVNLEDPDHISPPSFRTLVQMVQQNPQRNVAELPRPVRTNEWWKQDKDELSVHGQRPTHQACHGYDGVLRISAVGKDASTGAAFFTSILNQLIYAEKHNLKPWILLHNESSPLIYDPTAHNAHTTTSVFEMVDGMSISVPRFKADTTMFFPGKPVRTANELKTKPFQASGHEIWDMYFEPVSDFVPGDESCRDKPLLEMEEELVSPGLDRYCPWSVRAWHYDDIPNWVWPTNLSNASLAERFHTMRQQAATIVSKYYRFQQYLVQKAEEINPISSGGGGCLGVHLRNTNKGGQHRELIPPSQFLEYMEAYARVGGTCIFVATDSHRALQYIYNHFPEHITKRIRSQGPFVVRSLKQWPTYLLENRDRVNSETLVDILALSRCDLLLHGYSTVSEAAIYLNPALQRTSVNLEGPGRLSPQAFETLSRQTLGGTSAMTTPVDARNQLIGGMFEDAGDGYTRMRLDNATLLSHYYDSTKDQICKSNAIVYLAQKYHSSYNRDSFAGLKQSLELLHRNYLSRNNHKDNLDLFIFHTGDFDEKDLDELTNLLSESSLPEGQASTRIQMVDLSGSPYWERPAHHVNDKPEEWYAWPLFSEGYRRMMHFFAIDIWNFFGRLAGETGCDYQYIMRLDEDSLIHSPIEYDLFDRMQTQQYVYGYRMCAYEMKVTQRMWNLWRQRHPDFVPQREIDLNMCGFYNNFFVAHVPFFQSDAVQNFLKFIDRQGHIYRRRLGDLMIHSMAVYGFAPAEQIHRFLDFTYEHSTFNQTNGCLLWGGMQAGYQDSNASQTLQSFYETLTVERGCDGVNTSYMEANDLSPSYSHLTPTVWDTLRLRTVTAGKVEFPLGKGILSG